MHRWEYKFTVLPANNIEDAIDNKLNDLGEQGWELVSVVKDTYMTVAYFKRQKT